MDSTICNKYLVRACEIARDAGLLIMDYYTGGYNKSLKADNSPVTEADLAANNYITHELAKMAPQIPIIAEEDEEIGSSEHKLFFLVDPLDGTRAFVKGEPEFTVNIGLVEDKKPVLGVIYCPVQQILYYADQGGPAYRQKKYEQAQVIRVRNKPQDGITVVKSRSHFLKPTLEYLEKLNIKEMIPCSSSVKMCMIAEGNADLYPRFGRTMEWDTAAGHAILNAAGGSVTTTDGKPLLYGKSDFKNHGFIAFGDK